MQEQSVPVAERLDIGHENVAIPLMKEESNGYFHKLALVMHLLDWFTEHHHARSQKVVLLEPAIR